MNASASDGPALGCMLHGGRGSLNRVRSREHSHEAGARRRARGSAATFDTKCRPAIGCRLSYRAGSLDQDPWGGLCAHWKEAASVVNSKSTQKFQDSFFFLLFFSSSQILVLALRPPSLHPTTLSTAAFAQHGRQYYREQCGQVSAASLSNSLSTCPPTAPMQL